MRSARRRPDSCKDLSAPRGQLLVLLRADPTIPRYWPADSVGGFREGLKLCEEPPSPSAGQLWSRHKSFT